MRKTLSLIIIVLAMGCQDRTVINIKPTPVVSDECLAKLAAIKYICNYDHWQRTEGLEIVLVDDTSSEYLIKNLERMDVKNSKSIRTKKDDEYTDAESGLRIGYISAEVKSMVSQSTATILIDTEIGNQGSTTRKVTLIYKSNSWTVVNVEITEISIIFLPIILHLCTGTHFYDPVA